MPGVGSRSAPASGQPARAAGAADLVVESLTVRYGELTVLDDIHLRIPLAGRTVVIGPNGAGKTTLLMAIQGLVQAALGRISGAQAGGTQRPFRLAYVFQKPVMLRRSALGNVEHAIDCGAARQVRSRAARRALALQALTDVGLAALADRPARRLSGGEQQRLAIARANAIAPDCLLLDEPTSSLDPAASAAVERLLLRIADAGRGLLMTTHDLAQARRIARHVVFIHHGRIVEAGPADAFFDGPQTESARRFLRGDWLDDPP
ncbi:MAG: ATP-binding cassette domain-containing protein [Burkholderiaceae bacterium]|nr:ATP-binding cassette domain-containing protein [Burkholderiaceae bacterium]